MSYLFRKHSILEVIDQETGEIIYRESSTPIEVDSLLELMGYSNVEVELNNLASKIDEGSSVKYDDEGFPLEPEVKSSNISEDVEKLVHSDADIIDIPENVVDPIFSDDSDEVSSEGVDNDTVDSDTSEDEIIDDSTDEEFEDLDFSDLELDFSNDSDIELDTLEEDGVASDDVLEESETASEVLPEYPSDDDEEDDSGFSARIGNLDNLF